MPPETELRAPVPGVASRSTRTLEPGRRLARELEACPAETLGSLSSAGLSEEPPREAFPLPQPRFGTAGLPVTRKHKELGSLESPAGRKMAVNVVHSCDHASFSFVVQERVGLNCPINRVWNVVQSCPDGDEGGMDAVVARKSS